MGLSQAAGAPPAFFTDNFLTRDAFNAGAIVVSSGDAYKSRAYDMTRGDQWTSVGSNDSTTETYDAKLYAGSAQVQQTIDTIILSNINLKNFKLEWSVSGGAYTIFVGLDYRIGQANFSGTDLIINLAAPVVADHILLTMYTTQTANQEKQAKIIVCAMKFQTTKGMSAYKKAPLDVQKEVVMGDKSMRTTYVMRSPSSARFYQATLGFLACSQAERDNLDALATSLVSFVFLPEPGDRPQDVFRCKIVPSSFVDNYLSLDRSTKLWKIDLKVREVGGY